MNCPFCGSEDYREKMNSLVCNACNKNWDKPRTGGFPDSIFVRRAKDGSLRVGLRMDDGSNYIEYIRKDKE